MGFAGSTAGSLRVAHLAGPSVESTVTAHWLVGQILRRRKWALHRHVHLVADFEEMQRDGPVTSVLSVGCGAGLTELYLAVQHPGTSFTLTDFEPKRLAAVSRTAHDLDLPNVGVRSLDLLAAPDRERYDLVTSTEVLEHIDDDRRAASHMLSIARRFVWALIPACREQDLIDPQTVQMAWERQEHHRPGYTPRTLAKLFDAGNLRWLRSAYFLPEAAQIRQLLEAATREQLVEHRQDLLLAAASDVRDELRDGDGAHGIKVLVSP